MADRVRVGVVGTSWFAEMFHLPSLASHPAAEVRQSVVETASTRRMWLPNMAFHRCTPTIAR